MRQKLLLNRWNEGSALCGCIGGAVIALSMLIVRWTSGSPYYFLSQLKDDSLWVPVWLASLIWLAWYFALGFLWGFLLSDPRNRALARAVWFYRGSLYFVLGIFFGFMWYPLLFRIGLPFLSWLILLLSLVCMCMVGICWLRIKKGAWMVFGYCAWLLFMLLTQLVMLLNN